MTVEQDKTNLSRGVISPYGHIRHFVIEDSGFKSKLQNGNCQSYVCKYVAYNHI